MIQDSITQDLLDELIPRRLCHLKGTYRFDGGGIGTIRCRDLCNPAEFEITINRYAAPFPGADRRAAVSVWTMYYFSHLIVSPLVFWVVDGRILALGAVDLNARLDPETILPAGFVLRDAAYRDPATSVFDAMGGAVNGHARPLIEAISAQAGVSPRLLWSNVAVYTDWIIREMCSVMPERRAATLPLLDSKDWPDGTPNPLAGWIRQGTAPDGTFCTQRRVCCLRYILPGVPGCGAVCPIPAGRA